VSLVRLSATWLFLEEVIEGAAGVGRFDGRRTAGRTTGVPSFPFDRRASHEKLTPVSQIFLGNTFRYFLRALEPGGGIEMAAILAGTKVGFAFRTLAFEINLNRRGNDRST